MFGFLDAIVVLLVVFYLLMQPLAELICIAWLGAYILSTRQR